MATTYGEYTNASLATVLTALTDNGVGKERIVQIVYDGSAWHGIYVTQ